MPASSSNDFTQRFKLDGTLVVAQHYTLSEHVEHDLASAEYSRHDIELSIMRGSIRQRQADEMKQAVDGWKYIITGPGVAGSAFETVGKVIEWFDGQVYFLITAYGRS